MKPAVAAMIGVLVLSVAAPAAARTEPCAKVALTVPAGTVSSGVDGAEPTGHFQVGRAFDGTSWHVVLWQDGMPRILPDSYDGAIVGPAGQLIGSTPGLRGWRVRDGQQVTLPLPRFAVSATVSAVNAAGAIAGVAHRKPDSQDSWPVVWSADDTVRVLPRPDGYAQIQVSAIDADGTIVGTATKWDDATMSAIDQRAVVWAPDGSWQFLGASDPALFTSAAAIRDGVVGGWSSKDGTNTAITWSAGTATASVSGRNNGYLFNARGSIAVKAPQPRLVASDGTVRDLPVRDAVAGRASLDGLTDDVVYGTDSDRVAVRWTCA